MQAAALDPVSKVSVTLTTTPQMPAQVYTVTVNGVRDRTPGHIPIAPNSTASFMAVPLSGVFGNVPEVRNHVPLYSLNIPNVAMNGGNLAFAINKAFTQPRAAPTIIPARKQSSASKMESVDNISALRKNFMTKAEQTALNPKTDPIERSIPAVMITIHSPNAIIAIKENALAT